VVTSRRVAGRPGPRRERTAGAADASRAAGALPDHRPASERRLATFPLTVAAPGAGIRVRPERRLVTARAGERVTVTFDVAGAAPARAEVLAYSASPTSVRQLRAVASRVGPGRYAATLRTARPGRCVVSLLADAPALPAAGRASATLVVR
jgi:hypothetical protein